jgi:hypothetical protein
MNKINDLIQKYIQYSEAHRKFIQEGDHRKANSAYKSLTRLYRGFEKDKEMAESSLRVLCNEKSPAVRLWAATHAIGLDIQVDVAEKILEEIAETDKKGLLGFSAEMTLKEWKKNGKLNF